MKVSTSKTTGCALCAWKAASTAGRRPGAGEDCSGFRPDDFEADRRHDGGGLYVQRRSSPAAGATERGRKGQSSVAGRGLGRYREVMAPTGFLDFFTHAELPEAEASSGDMVKRPWTERIDVTPRTRWGFQLPPRQAASLSAPRCAGRSQFLRSTRGAPSCTLVLSGRVPEPLVEIPVPDEFRIGNVYSMVVFDLDPKKSSTAIAWTARGCRRTGTASTPQDSAATRTRRPIGGRDVWGTPPDWNNIYQHRPAIVLTTSTGSATVRSRSRQDLVIYEMHVRAFTRTPRPGVKHPGTFGRSAREDPVPEGAWGQLRGAAADLRVRRIRKQPYASRDRRKLYNFWGYSTVGFFAPKAGYRGHRAGSACRSTR